MHRGRRSIGWPTCSRSAPMASIAMAAAVIMAAAATPARAASETAFVRVNQLGYATASQAKRAYLMSSAAETGATFAVRNSTGTTVFSGPIGAKLGKWSHRYPDVYALDFSSVTTAGTYSISVSGPIAATHRPSRLTRRRTSTLVRWPTPCLSTRRSATDQTTSRTPCARRPDTSMIRTR